MKEFCKNFKWELFFRGLALLFAGIFLICDPTLSLKWFIYLIAAVVLLAGIMDVVGYFVNFGGVPLFRGSLFLGMPEILFSMLAFFRPDYFVNTFSFCFSVLIVASGIDGVEKAIFLGRTGHKGWLFELFVSCVVIGVGIALAFVPEDAANAFAIVCGSILIVDACLYFNLAIQMLRVRRKIDKFEKETHAVVDNVVNAVEDKSEDK